MRRLFLMVVYLAAAACSGDAPAPDRKARASLIASDPVVARALNDPLMSDPDLASRNEANAAIGFPDSHALPVLTASSFDADRARETLRLDLLNDGPIPDLPRPAQRAQGTPQPLALGPMANARQLLAAVDLPGGCADRLREDFALAASLPPVAVLPPRGMVMQAGGADRAPCGVRIIRYASAAAPQDVLQYHYAKAHRAGLQAVRYADPEPMIRARGAQSETLVVHARPGAHGLTSVDLIYRPRQR